MNKLCILLLGLAMTTVVTGVCTNPIIARLGMATSTTVNTPAVGDLTKCTGLTTACCTTVSINGIQTKVDALVTSLTTSVKARDTALLAARKAVAAISTTLIAFKTASAALAVHLALPATVAAAGAAAVSTHAVEYAGYVTAVITNYATIRTNYADTYQIARKTCIEKILATQASAYCFACSDDTSAVTGIDATSGEISLAAAAVASINTACIDYLTASDSQNAIFKLNSLLTKYADMTAALLLVTADNVAGVTAYNLAIASPTTTNVIAELPTPCTSSTCAWISTALFPVTALADTTLLTLGGQVATRRRVLEQSRLLAGDWAGTDVSATTATFLADPTAAGNPTDSMSAVIRNGVISCIAAVFVTLLV